MDKPDYSKSCDTSHLDELRAEVTRMLSDPTVTKSGKPSEARAEIQVPMTGNDNHPTQGCIIFEHNGLYPNPTMATTTTSQTSLHRWK